MIALTLLIQLLKKNLTEIEINENQNIQLFLKLNKQGLNIFHLNIHYLSPKFDQMLNFITIAAALSVRPDVKTSNGFELHSV
jgi:hypothetical protein